MKLRYIFTAAAALMAMASCSKMNDNIDQYLSQGEIIYIAKADSVHLYAGKERFKMEFWMSDPRATQMCIYWAQRTDSLLVDIPQDRNYEDAIVVMADQGITEGQYSLSLVTRDKYGNKSVIDEENVSVYGDIYAATLNDRLVDSKSVSSNNLTITWGNCYSDDEVGIRVWYTDLAGVAQVVTFPTETITDKSVIKSVDTTKEVSYSTMYMPEKTAIDTFFTKKVILTF